MIKLDKKYEQIAMLMASGVPSCRAYGMVYSVYKDPDKIPPKKILEFKGKAGSLLRRNPDIKERYRELVRKSQEDYVAESNMARDRLIEIGYEQFKKGLLRDAAETYFKLSKMLVTDEQTDSSDERVSNFINSVNTMLKSVRGVK